MPLPRGYSSLESAAGLDHSVVEIVVAILGSKAASALGAGAKEVGRDLWRKVILPHLEQKYGLGVLKEKPKSRSVKHLPTDTK